MSRRVPQLNDDAHIELRLPPETEEWAEDVLDDSGIDCERTEEALILRQVIGGNCNGLTVLRMFLDDVESAFGDGDIDPMEFTAVVTASTRIQQPEEGSA